MCIDRLGFQESRLGSTKAIEKYVLIFLYGRTSADIRQVEGKRGLDPESKIKFSDPVFETKKLEPFSRKLQVELNLQLFSMVCSMRLAMSSLIRS